jgi:hypothetical protein
MHGARFGHPDIEYFLNGPCNLDTVGAAVHLEGYLIAFLFLDIGLFGDNGSFNNVVLIHQASLPSIPSIAG